MRRYPPSVRGPWGMLGYELVRRSPSLSCGQEQLARCRAVYTPCAMVF